MYEIKKWTCSKLGTIESPQTEKGHCAKLYFILDSFLKQSHDYKWLFGMGFRFLCIRLLVPFFNRG